MSEQTSEVLQKVDDDTHDQLIDGLNTLIYAARHRAEADVLIARKALMEVFAGLLRTALKDTERLDWLLKTLVSYKAHDLTLCVEWWLPDGSGVKTFDRAAIDAAMPLPSPPATNSHES